MRNEQLIRDTLITNTVNLIAEGGFEKATTKAITHAGAIPDGVRMNEVYIYRLFGSKESLYQVAFGQLDQEFVLALEDCINDAGDLSVDTQRKLYEIFLRVWRFVLHNEDRCRCYVRFYYSVYFRGRTLANHDRMFAKIVRSFAPVFKDEADVESIMHSVLNTLLDFAVRVYNGNLTDDEINRPHIFNVLYNMMCTYFRENVRADVG